MAPRCLLLLTPTRPDRLLFHSQALRTMEVLDLRQGLDSTLQGGEEYCAWAPCASMKNPRCSFQAVSVSTAFTDLKTGPTEPNKRAGRYKLPAPRADQALQREHYETITATGYELNGAGSLQPAYGI